VNADGSYEYIPPPGIAGYDSFTYTVSDGTCSYDTATVTIEVEIRNICSISVDFQDWMINSGCLSGSFLVTNQSDGYDMQ